MSGQLMQRRNREGGRQTGDDRLDNNNEKEDGIEGERENEEEVKIW